MPTSNPEHSIDGMIQANQWPRDQTDGLPSILEAGKGRTEEEDGPWVVQVIFHFFPLDRSTGQPLLKFGVVFLICLGRNLRRRAFWGGEVH